MKLFTLILTTTCLLSISTVNFAQTSFINIKGIENNDGNMVTTPGSIKFNPNNIAQGILKVKMFNQPEGIYTVQLIDAEGNVLGNKEIHHEDGTVIETADFGKNFKGGTYQVVVINPSNKKTDETIMLLM
jgi:hypothetical protein